MGYSFKTLKDKKGITITNAFQKNLDDSTRKLNKAVNFTVDQYNHFCRIMILKCIRCIMKENLSLLKDSLTP